MKKLTTYLNEDFKISHNTRVVVKEQSTIKKIYDELFDYEKSIVHPIMPDDANGCTTFAIEIKYDKINYDWSNKFFNTSGLHPDMMVSNSEDTSDLIQYNKKTKTLYVIASPGYDDFDDIVQSLLCIERNTTITQKYKYYVGITTADLNVIEQNTTRGKSYSSFLTILYNKSMDNKTIQMNEEITRLFGLYHDAVFYDYNNENMNKIHKLIHDSELVNIP